MPPGPLQPDQLGGHGLDRGDEIDGAGGDRAQRHAVEARTGAIAALHPDVALNESQAAAFLDGLEAERAVGAGPRQHDADCVLAQAGGQAVEEAVDQAGFPRRVGDRQAQMEAAVDQRDRGMRRRHIDAIGFDQVAIDRFADTHRRPARQDVGQHALAVRGQVQHHHEGEARIGPHALEQHPECIEPARRCADADDAGKGADTSDGKCPGTGGGEALACHRIGICITMQIPSRSDPASATSGSGCPGDNS